MRVEPLPFGAQVAFVWVTGLGGWMSLGVLGLGAIAVGTLTIGALAIRAVALKRGKTERPNIEELEAGRLRVREPAVEQEQTPSRGVHSDGSSKRANGTS
jgi:hypothetical protein